MRRLLFFKSGATQTVQAEPAALQLLDPADPESLFTGHAAALKGAGQRGDALTTADHPAPDVL